LLEKWRREDPHDTPPSSRQAVTNFRAYLVEAWRQRWRAAFVLRHREVVTTSRDLSIRLAELARAIRDRIKTALAIETEAGPLTKLMKAFQEALVHDLDADGFADMYAQTIAYGLLSARIADPEKKTADDFAAHMRTNPFLREMMETFLKVGGRRGRAGGPGIDFDELGVNEVVDLLDDANMEAVVRDFGDRNPQEDPVIHFYELFLKEYDAKKRIQRGVFYTPRPVVSYIVRSVDELIRTEFGLSDGLADTTTWGEMARHHEDLKIPEGVSTDKVFVQILDPAVGTGTFLVEAIDLIHRTLLAKWKSQGHGETKIEALWNEYVPEHLLPRLHGYELLMAPYAIAHLKIGLKLYETGYRFDSDERARIYLTNALEPAHDFSATFTFAIPALAHEAQAVSEIKQKQRFTVVIGNPPYSYMSANLKPEHRLLVEAYKYLDGQRIKERGALQFELNIQDDYVKFLRLAEIVASDAGEGIVGFVTNNAFLANVTFRGMRQHMLTSFLRLWFLNLHGSLKAGTELGAGLRDENVFEIQQGVSISVLLRRNSRDKQNVWYGDLKGTRQAKYDYLMSEQLLGLVDELSPRCSSHETNRLPVSMNVADH
jgi:predicted helicase